MIEVRGYNNEVMYQIIIFMASCHFETLTKKEVLNFTSLPALNLSIRLKSDLPRFPTLAGELFVCDF
jgi:hypothetical protein